MTYYELFEAMCGCEMISYTWKHIIKMLAAEIDSEPQKDKFLKILLTYFSLIDDGNVYMSLKEDAVKNKIKGKAERLKVQFKEKSKDKDDDFDSVISEISDSFSELSKVKSLSIVGNNRFFIVEDDKLFTRKYYDAVSEIKKSRDRLFVSNASIKSSTDYHDYIDNEKFSLSELQEEVVVKGYYNNLLVTGGPGTGKTTSIFFLLLSLLSDFSNHNVYLTAPSGKAAARMKESIISSASLVDSTKITPVIEETINKIKELDEYTIHRLLKIDMSTKGFTYNKKNQFSENSIFIIDEASMTDVCVFASLLQAIPTGARVFILGDKNQIPSVECGAVFADLLESVSADNKVELTESKRFDVNSEVYELSEAINNGKELPEAEWKDSSDFIVEQEVTGRETPIYYYSDQAKNQTEMMDRIIKAWYERYYEKLQTLCFDIKENDISVYENILKESETARILCANNETVRGVNNINRKIIKEYFDDSKIISGYYPGELVMITVNNHALNLYNGDSGVAVKFAGDDTLYFMFKKKTKLNLDEGKFENKISKISDFVFYPARMISREEITSAFAITIHKSQGSDYKNILVTLPAMKGHPLLNRQIAYTAITRTKGNTYILSNQENLEAARDMVLERDTGVR